MHRSIHPVLGMAALAALTLTLQPLAVTAAPEAPKAPELKTMWKPDPASEPSEMPVPPMPKPLSAVRLREAQSRALKLVKATTLATTPQTLEMRLTPMTPRLENGTRIKRAYGVHVVEASTDVPDGMYWLLADDPDHTSALSIRVSTEKDKFYVADCRMLESHRHDYPVENIVTVEAPGLREDLTVVDGHLVFAFRGEDASSSVKLYYRDSSPNSARAMAFYGCDFGKAG